MPAGSPDTRMSNWRDHVLREFAPDVSRLTLVADPDGLLLEEGILAGVRERGFDLIPFDDHVAFRYAYESNFRSRWDRGEDTALVVVLRSGASDLGSLPYDLLQAGRKLSFNLGDIFPNLGYAVVASLDRGDLDRLYEAQERHRPGPLGDNAARDFVLRYVFEVAPELIGQEAELLRVLLRRHYRAQRIPWLLDQRLIELLRQRVVFRDWPLDKIVPDREFFLGFLQERWPFFLDRQIGGDDAKVHDPAEGYGLDYPGPVDLPFDHDDVRVYIDNLFVEGFLQPVAHGQAASLAGTWAAVGVRTTDRVANARRADALIRSIEQNVPEQDARYEEWLHYARGWAELLALAHGDPNVFARSAARKFRAIRSRNDSTFEAWLWKRYATLFNLPPSPPVMLHHLPRYVARHIADDRTHKAALVVVDGLSFDQWVVLRAALADGVRRILVRDGALFAWIPTITAISRQAVFSGLVPAYFPDTIHTTDREPALWSRFWMDQGLKRNEVAYVKRLGDGPLEDVEKVVAHPKTRVVGLVVDKVDRIMHGMDLGSAGMYNQVRQWSQQPFMGNLVDLLVAAGYQIYLTSDHGNVEASGCGRPAEGAVADLRGERARIYSDQALRDRVRERFPNAVEWPPAGLPSDCLPLLAPRRAAFVREGERIVGHGGMALEEVIVPFVRIEGKGP